MSIPKKLRIPLELAVIGVVAYLLASGALALLTAQNPQPPPTARSRAIPLPPPKAPPPPHVFDAIHQRNMFHAFDPLTVKPPPPKKLELTELPVAQVPVRLIGTIYSTDPYLRRAIVIEGNQQRLARVSEHVGGRAIKDIHRRAITLVNADKKELLLIEGNDVKIAANSDVGRVSYTRKEVQKRLRVSPDMLEGLSFTPSEVTGHKGLLITALSEKNFLYSVGLRRNDLILGVNGKPLNDFQAIASLDKLTKKNKFDIEVFRDGKRKKIAVNLIK